MTHDEEVKAIDDAYADKLKELYGVALTGLVMGTDDVHVLGTRFIEGALLARQAAELAKGWLEESRG